MTQSNSRDDFTKKTADVIGKRAAFICSNPDCRAFTLSPSEVDDDKFIYIGKAAHICAASPGGPRYDAEMTPEQRSSAPNGIFCCSSCADMFDKNNGADFSVALLRKWKFDHEKWVSENLNKNPSAKQHATVINVTSHNQQGGITAGVVNIGKPRRELNDQIRSQLLQALPDKSKEVVVTAVMGDGEALSFATRIKEFLILSVYSAHVDQAMYDRPVKPLVLNPAIPEIIVGCQQ